MPIDAWPIDASAGAPGYSGQELRFGTVVPFLAGAGASLGVRSGVRPSGSGTDLLVQAQASPGMTVKVNPGVIAVQGGISATQGAYTWALDTTTNLTIAAAHASLTRTDLVVVRIRDASVDTSGQRDGSVIVITGTAGGGVPSLPTDATYITIAQVAVGAAVSSIVAGNITDKRPFTTGLGGVLLCDANSEPSASSVPANQLAYRSDLGVFRAPAGSSWRMVTPYRQVIGPLSAAQATVTFNGFPAGLKNMRITYACHGDAVGPSIATQVALTLTINGAAGTSYSYLYHQVHNATVETANSTSSSFFQVGVVPANQTMYGDGEILINGWDLTSSQTNRLHIVSRSASYTTQADSILFHGGGIAVVTPPWTSITLALNAGSFAAGSRFALEAWDN